MLATMSCVGKEFSEEPRSGEAIEAYADAMADMLLAYLQWLSKTPEEQTGILKDIIAMIVLLCICRQQLDAKRKS